MNPLTFWMNEIMGEALPKIKVQKPDSYYINTPKSKRKRVGTGTYRNGKEIMKAVSREQK